LIHFISKQKIYCYVDRLRISQVEFILTDQFFGLQRLTIPSNHSSGICTVETNKSLPKTTLYPISLRLPHHIHYLPHSSVVFMFVCQSWVLDFYSLTPSIVHVAFILHCEGGRIHFFLIIRSNNARHSWFSSMRQRRVWSNLECQHHHFSDAGNQRKSIQIYLVFLQEETKEF